MEKTTGVDSTPDGSGILNLADNDERWAKYWSALEGREATGLF
jgi:hypothetical protein